MKAIRVVLSDGLTIMEYYKNQLQDFLINEAEYDEEEVLNMHAYELIDKWLRYEGLIGWTDDIISTVKSLMNEL